jgi:hypothetical protein
VRKSEKKTAPAAENQNSSHIGGVLFNKCLLDIKRRQSRKATNKKKVEKKNSHHSDILSKRRE